MSLDAGSVVSEAGDSPDAFALSFFVVAATRRAVQELAENAGRISTYTLALGPNVVLDATGDANTLYVSSGASTQADSGWFVVEAADDSWGRVTTGARLRLRLRRIAGPVNAIVEGNGCTEFLAHDF